nr:hypothetical protein [Tanacetum cinerariifolium]
MASNFAKLNTFKGVNFRIWQKKMHVLLSSMSVVYVLTTPIPEDGDDATVEQLRKKAKWDNDDYDSLEAKYMAEDASSKKFLVSNFTNYKMTDSRPVMEQYNKLLCILERFTQHKINMDKAIQVSCIIDKPPPSWKDFKLTLKHLKEELTLFELVICALRSPSRYNDNKDKRKHHNNTKADPNKKAKSTCWKCRKTGHIKRDCKGVNVSNKANSSGTKGLVDGSSNSLKGHNMFNKSLQVYYVTYVSEAYFVQDDDIAWWVDAEATVHVCKDRLPSDVYSLVNHQRVAKDIWERVELLMQVNQQTHLAEFPQIDSGLAVPVFKQGDDPIDVINKMYSFLSTVGERSTTSKETKFYAASSSGTRDNTSGIGGRTLGQQRVVKCFNCQREGHMARQCTEPKRKRDATWFRDKVLLVEAQGNGTVLNDEELEFFSRPLALMDNVSRYNLDVHVRKLKGKDIVDNGAQVSNTTTIAPGMYKLDPVTLAHKDKNKWEAHIYYLKHTIEQAANLKEIVERDKSLNHLDIASYSTYKYVK